MVSIALDKQITQIIPTKCPPPRRRARHTRGSHSRRLTPGGNNQPTAAPAAFPHVERATYKLDHLLVVRIIHGCVCVCVYAWGSKMQETSRIETVVLGVLCVGPPQQENWNWVGDWDRQTAQHDRSRRGREEKLFLWAVSRASRGGSHTVFRVPHPGQVSR